MAAPRSAKFFQYTSGRWLQVSVILRSHLNAEEPNNSYNESKRPRERYLPFNITELSKFVAASVGRKSDVQSINKLAEGGFNRVCVLIMRDGFQLIARLPYPITQPH